MHKKTFSLYSYCITLTQYIHDVVILGLPTKDEVMSLLYEIADQWKTVANSLGMDEGWIDEIDTNNAVDILCLDNIVDVWIQRMRPTWKKLSLVLRDMGRNDLADKAWNDGKIILSSLLVIISCD